MSHDYNTRTKKVDFHEALANLELSITNSISAWKTEIKDEIINMKDVVI